MDPHIVAMNDRGQLTLPKTDRDSLGAHYFVYTFDGTNITLTPLQTREAFLTELEASEKDWKENGGYTLKEMHKRHGI